MTRYSLVARGVTSWSTLRSPNLSPLGTSRKLFRLTRSWGTRPWPYHSMSLPIKYIWFILSPSPYPQPAGVLFGCRGPNWSPQKKRQQKEGHVETLRHQVHISGSLVSYLRKGMELFGPRIICAGLSWAYWASQLNICAKVIIFGKIYLESLT